MRIQILQLPSVMVGDDLAEPFALVVDQFEWPIDDFTTEKWQQFKDKCGARAILIDPGMVEIVDRHADSGPSPVAVNLSDQVINDDAPETIAEDMQRITAGWPRIQRQPPPIEYHWMITYIVPKAAGGFDFRQKSGLCQPGGRTRSDMFAALGHQVMSEDGLGVADFSVVYFGLEPERVAG